MTLRTDSTRRADRPSVVRPPSPHGRLRWAVVGMCFLGVAVKYLDRADLSIGMPEIVAHFGISHTLEGLILGAFFWTDARFQLPAGHLIDNLGDRATYAFAV